MKVLTTNFLTCAVKPCKTSPASYPLHFRDATLERIPLDFQPEFIRNILPRLNWDALRTTANELGLGALVPDTNPGEIESEDDDEGEDEEMRDQPASGSLSQSRVEGEGEGTSATDPVQGKDVNDEVLQKLHGLLLETCVMEGKLVCGNCGFEYPIKEGVGNFLLPAHLV